MQITFSNNIRSVLNNIRLLVLQFKGDVDNYDYNMWKVIEDHVKTINQSIQLENINKIEAIKATRQAYKTCGKDPNRYRPSAESLMRRIVKGNDLYKVNNVVDVLNFISFQSGISIGGYDTDKVVNNVLMDIGKSSDNYIGIGRGVLNIEGLPVLRDDMGVFGSPTSDSERTMIKVDTKNFLFIFFDFGLNNELINYAEKTTEYLKKYTNAKEISQYIIEV